MAGGGNFLAVVSSNRGEGNLSPESGKRGVNDSFDDPESTEVCHGKLSGDSILSLLFLCGRKPVFLWKAPGVCFLFAVCGTVLSVQVYGGRKELVSVSDSGCGMSVEQSSRRFCKSVLYTGGCSAAWRSEILEGGADLWDKMDKSTDLPPAVCTVSEFRGSLYKPGGTGSVSV